MIIEFIENNVRKAVNLNLCSHLEILIDSKKPFFELRVYQNTGNPERSRRTFVLRYDNEEELNAAWDSLMNAIKEEKPYWIAPKTSKPTKTKPSNEITTFRNPNL